MAKEFYYETKIYNNIIDKINNIIDNNLIKNRIETNKHSTHNGFQTHNIIDLFSENLLKEIVPVNNLYKDIFHIHYISYNKGGFQKLHNHIRTEKLSFILYLNDSDGNTVFSDILKEAIPSKGKLIVFSSNLMHYSKPSYKNKKIIVGAISKK
jgi:hypothetical protein